MHELRRTIRHPHATALVVGTIIGASIFVQQAEIAALVPSVGGVLLVWLVSGVLTLFGALVCAELASIFTRTGGVYVYLKEAFSPSVGFLWGWAMFWTMHSGIIAAIAVIFGRYLVYFFPGFQGVSLVEFGVAGQAFALTWVDLFAIALIIILTAVNYIGVRLGSLIQTAFTGGKIAALVFILAAGFILGSRLPEHFVVPQAFATGASVQDFGLALVAGLFAFGGWHMVTYNAEETINPKRTIPRALVIGTFVVTACYIALNAAYMYILPLDRIAGSERIAADAADALFGRGGGGMMAGLVVFSTFGALTGIVLAGPRVYYAMARDGLLFGWFGSVHPRHRTPHRAIVLQAVWSSFLVLTGSYRVQFSRVVYTEWIFFGLLAVGLILLRRRTDLMRDYSVWGYPAVPIIFAIASFAIVVNHVVSDIMSNGVWTRANALNDSLFGLGLVLIGLPVYYIWRTVRQSRISNKPQTP